MKYVIVKELLPSLIDSLDYDESMNFVRICSEIKDDKLYTFDNLLEAEQCKSELEKNINYAGRKLKIIEAMDL